MNDHLLQQLQLLQLADSAVPIGGTAHSFGPETLIADGCLTTDKLESFLRIWLGEVGVLEGAFCRQGSRLAQHQTDDTWPTLWRDLNVKLSALKPAREGRTASATLGRRLLRLVAHVATPPVAALLDMAQSDAHETHYGPVFGLVGGTLEVDEETIVCAYLHQTIVGFVSACQRLLPLGQHQASQIIWQIKPALIAAAADSQSVDPDTEFWCFAPELELAGMRHPLLRTRLFIS